MAAGPEGQLELFDVGRRDASPPPPRIPGWLILQIRHEQLALAGIAGLIGVTVVFAMGVERGKQLLRAQQRPFLARQEPEPARAQRTTVTPDARPAVPDVKASPKETPSPSAPKATRSVKSRYAVQVATYSRMQLARQELERLQRRGERAFLVTRGTHTSVYVGPLASKENAREKIGTLKSRYGDCFVRSL